MSIGGLILFLLIVSVIYLSLKVKNQNERIRELAEVLDVELGQAPKDVAKDVPQQR